MADIDIQFSNSDLFVVREYLQFYFNEVSENCWNRLQWLTWLWIIWLTEIRKLKRVWISINKAVAWTTDTTKFQKLRKWLYLKLCILIFLVHFEILIHSRVRASNITNFLYSFIKFVWKIISCALLPHSEALAKPYPSSSSIFFE